jgi:hypothetical protein
MAIINDNTNDNMKTIKMTAILTMNRIIIVTIEHILSAMILKEHQKIVNSIKLEIEKHLRIWHIVWTVSSYSS